MILGANITLLCVFSLVFSLGIFPFSLVRLYFLFLGFLQGFRLGFW